jgi:hypothetical protein
MPGSHRARGSSHPTSLILPFALTLTTAALASAGLYFFSDGSSSPYSSSSDGESDGGGGGGRGAGVTGGRSRSGAGAKRALKRERRWDREHDHITEEDTDALESFGRDEGEFGRRPALSRASARAVGAVERDRARSGAGVGVGVVEASGAIRSAPEESGMERVRSGAGGGFGVGEVSGAVRGVTEEKGIERVRSRAGEVSGAIRGAVGEGAERYVPTPRRRRNIALVVGERLATTGHESDGLEFVDAFEGVCTPPLSPRFYSRGY